MVLEARLDSSRLHAALGLTRSSVLLHSCLAWDIRYTLSQRFCSRAFLSLHYTTTGVQALVRSSPKLAAQPEFQALSNLRGVDVVAVRLFFKERLDMPRAASVAGGGMAPGKKHAGSWCEIALADLTACRPCYPRILMHHQQMELHPSFSPGGFYFSKLHQTTSRVLVGFFLHFCGLFILI